MSPVQRNVKRRLAEASLGSYDLHQLREHAFPYRDLGLGQLFSQPDQLLPVHELSRTWKHLRLFLLRMMLDQILQHFGLGREFVGGHRRSLELRQHGVDDVLLLGGVPEGGVEDLLLDRRVDLDLLLYRLQELFTPAQGSGRRFAELRQQLANLFMVSLEQGDCILLLGAAFCLGHRWSSWRQMSCRRHPEGVVAARAPGPAAAFSRAKPVPAFRGTAMASSNGRKRGGA